MTTGTDAHTIALLRRLGLNCLRALRVRHSDWTSTEARAALDLPESTLTDALLAEAGFPAPSEPSPQDTAAVLMRCAFGVWSAEVIAAETGLSLATVRRVFVRCSIDAAQRAYAERLVEGHRQLGNGNRAVPRRVTAVGQISYRGQLYTLGVAYRGRVALVIEQGRELHLRFVDRPPVVLALRTPVADTARTLGAKG